MGLFKFISDAQKKAEELQKKVEESAKKLDQRIDEMMEDDDDADKKDYADKKNQAASAARSFKNSIGFLQNGVLTINEGVAAMDEYCLDDFGKINAIVFPSTLRFIDASALDGHSEIRQLDFSKVRLLRTLPTGLFTDMPKLKEVEIPEGVEVIESGLFCDCPSLEKVVLPGTLRKTDDLFDGDCEKVAVVDMSKVHLLEEIPEYFLAGAERLKSVIIPQGVKVLGEWFVSDCVKEIYIPSSVTDCGYLVDGEPEGLTTHVFSDDIEDMDGIFEESKNVRVHESACGKYSDKLRDSEGSCNLFTMPDNEEYPQTAAKMEHPAEETHTPTSPTASTSSTASTSPLSSSSPTAPASPTASSSPSSSAATPPPPPVFSYYVLLEGNKQEGPCNEPQFSRLVRAGMVTADTYVWKEGMAEWRLAGDVPALARFFQ